MSPRDQAFDISKLERSRLTSDVQLTNMKSNSWAFDVLKLERSSPTSDEQS